MRRFGDQVVPFMEPIHIVGSGSIGLLFAGSIRAAFPSYPLSVLLREHHRSKIDEDSKIMTCLLQGGRPRMVPVPAQIIGDHRPRPIQNLLVATKAYAAAEAVNSLLHRLEEAVTKVDSVSIILICNGAMAVKDELLQLLAKSSLEGKYKLVLATTTHGAFQETGDDDMYRVVHAGQGSTFVEEHPSLSQLLDQSALNSESISSRDMDVLLWKKLAVNCAINPFTALYDCENGQIIQQQTINSNELPSVEEVIQEVSSIATKTSPSPSQLDYESLRSFVFTVIDDTFYNRSSMLQDVTKKQRTEVEYLNGYVVDKGKFLSVDTPANSVLCNRIQELPREVE